MMSKMQVHKSQHFSSQMNFHILGKQMLRLKCLRFCLLTNHLTQFDLAKET